MLIRICRGIPKGEVEVLIRERTLVERSHDIRVRNLVHLLEILVRARTFPAFLAFIDLVSRALSGVRIRVSPLEGRSTITLMLLAGGGMLLSYDAMMLKRTAKKCE